MRFHSLLVFLVDVDDDFNVVNIELEFLSLMNAVCESRSCLIRENLMCRRGIRTM